MIHNSEKGFTLIELLVVFSILSFLGITGIASFASYTRIQSVNSATSELASVFYTARSRALSQVKPNTRQCTTEFPGGGVGPTIIPGKFGEPPLDGYKVVICPGGCSANNYHYRLIPLCGGGESPPVVDKKLPTSVVFPSTIERSFTFSVLNGAVSGGGISPGSSASVDVQYVSDSNLRKAILIYSDGRIGVN